MAQSHNDRPDHKSDALNFMDRLRERAGQAIEAKASMIASGMPGERPMRDWQANGVHVTEMPADEQGILRISIGGGPCTPVQLNYCTFRGDHGQCVGLLRKALKALEGGE